MFNRLINFMYMCICIALFMVTGYVSVLVTPELVASIQTGEPDTASLVLVILFVGMLGNVINSRR